LIILFAAILTACSKSDDQREFENESLSLPEGITEMTAAGEPLSGKGDPDDWRVSPMSQGLIRVDVPAYPNPVALGSVLNIELYIMGVQVINEIEVFAFKHPSSFSPPIYTKNDLSSTGFTIITLNAETVAYSSGGGGAAGIYRV